MEAMISPPCELPKDNEIARVADSATRTPTRESDLDSVGKYQPQSELSAPNCPVCAALADTDSQYFSGLTAGSHRLDVMADAVARTMGFCVPHSRTLAQRRDRRLEIAKLLRYTIEHVRRLFDSPGNQDDLMLQTFFNARHACATCNHRHQNETGKINQRAKELSKLPFNEAVEFSGLFCVPHFRMLTAVLKPPMVHSMLRERAIVLRSLVATLRIGMLGPCEQVESNEVTLSWTMANIICFLAGAKPHISSGSRIHRPGMLSHACLYADPGAALADPAHCPVCAELEHAAGDWATSIRAAANLGEDLWVAFPTCPSHVWTCYESGDKKIAAAGLLHAAEMALRQLEHASESPATTPGDESDGATGNDDPKMNGRAKPRRKAPVVPPRCRGCERLDLARDRAVNRLLSLLQESELRNAMASGHGLCMKHFAETYVIAPAGKIRSALTTTQSEKLRSLHSQLDDLLNAGSGEGTAGHGDAFDAVFECALYRLSGDWQMASAHIFE